jgi:long-chain acyl-CoA synthetase
VREFTVPPATVLAPEENLGDIVFRNADQHPDAVVFARPTDAGAWTDVTAREFAEQVAALAKGLMAAGVAAGDRVGLLSKTRYEWTLADVAILTAGGVTVPIYETSSPEQVAWNLGDSGTAAVIVETAEHRSTYDAGSAGLPDITNVWTIDDGDLDRLMAAGREVDDGELDRRRAELSGGALASIIYTSGTTGRPKGCELTHRNLLSNVVAATTCERELFAPGSSTLLFLPLAHAFARIIQFGCVHMRVRLGHTADVQNLLPDLAAFQPTFVLSVPRVFEKIYNGARTKARAAGSGKGKIFDLADAVAVRYSEALDRGRPSPVLAAQHALFDRLVYAKIRSTLGGRVRYAVSGGAPLGARLGHFFRGIGITIIEGYGLTETAPVICANRPDHIKIGTVGQPIPGVTVRIADDGEVVTKGDNVFRGYWRNEAATADVLDADGWFHTGDVGELDGDGFLRITGRKKEIIVTANGKNVSPAVLEDGLRASPLVSQCMVVGDQKPFVAALITLDAEALESWKKEHGKPPEATVAELKDDAALVAAVQDAVDAANRAVSRAEAIRTWRILDRDFSEEGGHMTPTLKLKRSLVAKDYAAEIDRLYS